jgi:stringent starvation protein B
VHPLVNAIKPYQLRAYCLMRYENMQAKKLILIVALVAVLATVSVVAADEAGIITINISNNPNSQLNTEISNSTIQGHTNYTNSNAQENITLTNSTLTITVNGQNITMTSQGDNLTITTPNQPTKTATPTPTPTTPLLTVNFLDSNNGKGSPIMGNASYAYDFNVTVGVPTSMNFPWGKNVTHDALNKALMPLIDKYTWQPAMTG